MAETLAFEYGSWILMYTFEKVCNDAARRKAIESVWWITSSLYSSTVHPTPVDLVPRNRPRRAQTQLYNCCSIRTQVKNVGLVKRFQILLDTLQAFNPFPKHATQKGIGQVAVFLPGLRPQRTSSNQSIQSVPQKRVKKNIIPNSKSIKLRN